MALQQVAAAASVLLFAVFIYYNVAFVGKNRSNDFVLTRGLPFETLYRESTCTYSAISSSYSDCCHLATDARFAAIVDARRRRSLLIVRSRLRYCKSPVCYYNNSDATFNLELGPLLLTCIHPNPGPDHTSAQNDQPRRMDVNRDDGDQSQPGHYSTNNKIHYSSGTLLQLRYTRSVTVINPVLSVYLDLLGLRRHRFRSRGRRAGERVQQRRAAMSRRLSGRHFLPDSSATDPESTTVTGGGGGQAGGTTPVVVGRHRYDVPMLHRAAATGCAHSAVSSSTIQSTQSTSAVPFNTSRDPLGPSSAPPTTDVVPLNSTAAVTVTHRSPPASLMTDGLLTTAVSLDIPSCESSSTSVAGPSVVSCPDVNSNNFSRPVSLPSQRFLLPNILLANIRSIMNKSDELSAVLRNNKIDIACITESWLNDSVPTEVVDISGYDCFRRDRCDGRRGGGVACYVRNNVSCRKLDILDSDDTESLWLLHRASRMPKNVSHIAIGIIYHPPKADSSVTISHINDSLDYINRIHPYAGIILLGDFNQLADGPIKHYPLKQVVKSATRGTAILDKIYTNISNWYCDPEILPGIATSDHFSVVMQPKHSNQYPHGKRIRVLIRSNDPNGKALLANELCSFNWSRLYTLQSCEDMISMFYSTVTSMLNYFLPTRHVFRHSSDKPWVTDEFRRLIRQRQHAFTSGNITEYRKLRNKINRAAKELQANFYKKRIDGLRNCDPSNWWTETKKLTGQASKSDLTGLASSLTDGNMAALARIINVSLKEVSDDLEPLSNTCPISVDEFPDRYTIYPIEVFFKLNNINIRKAPGPDGLPNWLLRDFSAILCDPLCAIFNMSLRTGHFPGLWKKANVIPVPKVKPPTSIESDLRPISLTPTVSKIFESIVGHRILETTADKFDLKQFGAIKGRSTVHALTDILHIWHSALDRGKSVRAVFIDYAKAFDHVHHGTILQKMAAFDIEPCIIRWMHSFLVLRTQRVKLNRLVSPWVTLSGGIPQGTWFGPYVFLVLINDLVTSLTMHKFIDDTTITEIIPKHNNSVMQIACSETETFSYNNFMNINTKKTKEMLLGSITRSTPDKLYINNLEIERVKKFKLLGITINDKLKWNEHVDSICAKVNKRLYFLKKLRRANMSGSDLLFYYKSIIRRQYACVVWHPGLTKSQSHSLEALQRRAFRTTLSHNTD